jgi:hypothetical protein
MVQQFRTHAVNVLAMVECVLVKQLILKFQPALKLETEFRCLAAVKLVLAAAQLVIYMWKSLKLPMKL